MRQELAAAREVAARASGTWDKFRKERDFHRMHHKRVAQEKNKLITDIKRLKVSRMHLPVTFTGCAARQRQHWCPGRYIIITYKTTCPFCA